MGDLETTVLPEEIEQEIESIATATTEGVMATFNCYDDKFRTTMHKLLSIQMRELVLLAYLHRNGDR